MKHIEKMKFVSSEKSTTGLVVPYVYSGLVALIFLLFIVYSNRLSIFEKGDNL